MNLTSTKAVRTLAVLALVSGFGMAEAKAGMVILGTQVTGTLNFPALGGLNYFDPANRSVPSGFLNAAGPTVTIAEPAIEFGFQDFANRDTANFTDTQLIVTDIVSFGAAPFFMTFTDAAFTDLSLVSSNFPGLTGSISGNVITISSSRNFTRGTYTAIFNVNASAAVPEPSSLALTASAAALGFATWIRRRKRATA